MPTGVSGIQTKVIAPATIAVILPALVRTCGMIKATNAAGKAASRPHEPGSSRIPHNNTPKIVPVFQNIKRLIPVNQNESRESLLVSCALAIAMVSSITK